MIGQMTAPPARMMSSLGLTLRKRRFQMIDDTCIVAWKAVVDPRGLKQRGCDLATFVRRSPVKLVLPSHEPFEFDAQSWPTVIFNLARLDSPEWQHFRDGQEAQSRSIRRDPARLCGRRDGSGISQEAWHTSTDGAPSHCERDPAMAREAHPEAAEDRSAEGCQADRQAPRKQQHTAHRIWTRLGEGHPEFPIAVPTVRQYVRKGKQELGGRMAFVPRSYDWGQEARVDWFGTVARLEGEPCKLRFFAMRSMAWGDAFDRAYTHATQQALLEAHELAFAKFGGVLRTVRYDFVPGHKIVICCRRCYVLSAAQERWNVTPRHDLRHINGLVSEHQDLRFGISERRLLLNV